MLRAAASCAAILIVASACGWPGDPADSVERAQQALADAHLAEPADPDGAVPNIRINPGLAEKLRALGYGM